MRRHAILMAVQATIFVGTVWVLSADAMERGIQADHLTGFYAAVFLAWAATITFVGLEEIWGWLLIRVGRTRPSRAVAQGPSPSKLARFVHVSKTIR